MLKHQAIEISTPHMANLCSGILHSFEHSRNNEPVASSSVGILCGSFNMGKILPGIIVVLTALLE
jgi:hypothetical protein